MTGKPEGKSETTGLPAFLLTKEEKETGRMAAVTLEETVLEYPALVKRQGLLYDRSPDGDAGKRKDMKRKAEDILTGFVRECGFSKESIRAGQMGDMIRASLRDWICLMSRKSGEEYRVINEYFAFLRDRYAVVIAPFLRQLTALERQLSIAGDLHDFDRARTFDREKEAEKYLVSTRTIDSDLKALHEGISVLDQRLAPGDFRLKNKQVTALSALHPLFLARNLTRVDCLLEGLRAVEGNPVLFSYARNTAVSIRRRLSDYAGDGRKGACGPLSGAGPDGEKEGQAERGGAEARFCPRRELCYGKAFAPVV